MVPRWIQAVVLPLAIVGAFLLLKAAGPVALIFIVAALVALLLNPFVVMLQRARFPRGVAVLCVYLALIVCLTGIVAVLADPIGDQVVAVLRQRARASSTTPTPSCPTSRTGSTTTASTSRSPSRARRRWRRSARA